MGILRGSKQSPTPLLSEELDMMVISRLCCGKIVLIASKPTLEIREGDVDVYKTQHHPFFFYYLSVYPIIATNYYPFWINYKNSLHDNQR